ncbi:MAG: hypothetical protein AB2A00_34395 [Myxococcota bacterium]
MKPQLMISSLLFTAALSLQAAPAHAGVYVEEVHTMSAAGMPAQSRTVKTWIEGDMVRTDDPQSGGVILINTRKNLIQGVHPSDKTWWQLKEQDMAMFGMATVQAYGVKMGPDGKVQVPQNIFQKTGNRKKIGEWDAYEVKVNIEGGQAKGFSSTLWFANVPGYDPVHQRNRVKMWMGNGPEADAFMKQWDALEGVPVLTEMKVTLQGQTLEVRQELKKVAPQKVRPQDLQIPKGFKQVEDPFTQLKRQMPQQGMPGGATPPPLAP